ncbi:MAG TPA: class I SAM-dependent methyltransferase [Puia sp.]|nr:class I SAM-dependent methyltransferase [Puia sp.]
MSEFEREYYEAESFWEGEMLQDAPNTERILFTSKIIPDDVKSIADVGCGNGIFVNHLKEARPLLEIMAIDRSQTALKYVKTPKKAGDISEIPMGDKSVDCATCLEVIEHLPVAVYERALDELARIAKDYIIISVPYKERLDESFNQCPSCESIFNYELHLRHFDDPKMKKLMEPRGFSCVGCYHLGEMTSYKWHYEFRKIFYREQFRQWKSPICPICGYKGDISGPQVATRETLPEVRTTNAKRKLISYISRFPKAVWPREKRYYWIIALYKRKL